ncbi:MAG: hypothetical protein PVG79_08230 [Gemmatimonadales bacterium]|jgi:hypothetical protein
MSPSEPIAFVIMPFAEEYVAGFRDVVQPAVERAGMCCVRADQDPQGDILRMMFERIFDSPALIADISGSNPNVFYELGVSHCVGAKTITVCREDFMDHVPFDLGTYRILVYPKPPADHDNEERKADYSARVNEAVEKLAAELMRLVQNDSAVIPNPVQTFVESRSPLTCVESRFLDELSGRWEEELLHHTEQELVCVALGGSHFAGVLGAYADSGRRETPLHVKFLLLDPEDREGWSFVYRLREGRPLTDTEIDELIADDRVLQRRTEQVVARLGQTPNISGQVEYYRGVPLFWAYWLDRRRIIVGYLAAGRLSSRSLPVTVIVRDDPRTSVLCAYYASAIDALTEH